MWRILDTYNEMRVRLGGRARAVPKMNVLRLITLRVVLGHSRARVLKHARLQQPPLERIGCVCSMHALFSLYNVCFHYVHCARVPAGFANKFNLKGTGACVRGGGGLISMSSLATIDACSTITNCNIVGIRSDIARSEPRIQTLSDARVP